MGLESGKAHDTQDKKIVVDQFRYPILDRLPQNGSLECLILIIKFNIILICKIIRLIFQNPVTFGVSKSIQHNASIIGTIFMH